MFFNFILILISLFFLSASLIDLGEVRDVDLDDSNDDAEETCGDIWGGRQKKHADGLMKNIFLVGVLVVHLHRMKKLQQPENWFGK